MAADNATIPASTTDSTAPAKRSPVEGMKETSRQLRGTLAEELTGDVDHFNETNKNLIKFHGSYQQENRDARKTRGKTGVGKHYMFMVRCKIPGGKLTAAQYLAMDELAGNHANGTLRFTTRQGIQLHGVLKDNLKETIAGINTCLLTTLGACGDVNRNVMFCPVPRRDSQAYRELHEVGTTLAAHLAPRTMAYHEIWLNGKALHTDVTPADYEPIYGKVYLPRKFKIGLTFPENNVIDLYAQDLGLLALVENDRIVGWNVYVGGGMGMTHGNANTFPYLAQPICYVPAAAVVNAAEAVIKLFRDHGNRADRKRARIKYVVHDWGVAKFREVLSEYVGAPLALPKPVEVSDFDLALGWHPQGDGRYWYGLSIENGRVKDEGALKLRTALRTLVQRLQPDLCLTPMQDILLCNLDANARPEIEKLLLSHGVPLPEQVSNVQKYSMACPAIPTCGLAISEAERALPKLVDQLEVALRELDLADEKISVRMTGCPNGCARPYQSDIGIVGRSGDKYTLFVGGNVLGTRLNFPLQDLVPQADIVPLLRPVLADFKQQRQPGEGFGDYCQRLGVDKLHALLPEALRKEPAKAHAEPARLTQVETAPSNGTSTHEASNGTVATPALPQPDTRSVSLALAQPSIRPATDAAKEAESVLSGPAGEELHDYTHRYGSDGSVRETLVYFYGDDQRSRSAHAGLPLRRKAAYAGHADPARLYAARKLSDTYYVGTVGHERKDMTIEYDAEGRRLRTILFLYEGEKRAADVGSGTPIRRQIQYGNE